MALHEAGAIRECEVHGWIQDRADPHARQYAMINAQEDPPPGASPEEWQTATQALLLVAEHDGPTMLARIGVMRALNRHVERVFNTNRKDPHWGRRKLARDR